MPILFGYYYTTYTTTTVTITTVCSNNYCDGDSNTTMTLCFKSSRVTLQSTESVLLTLQRTN